MELYPQDGNQHKLVYNMAMALLTVVVALQVPNYGPWIALGFAIIWAGLWFFDMYVGPWLWPEPENISEEEKMQRAAMQWFMADRDKVMNQLKEQADLMKKMQDRFDATISQVQKEAKQ